MNEDMPRHDRELFSKWWGVLIVALTVIWLLPRPGHASSLTGFVRAAASEFYVSTGGYPLADGSFYNPWDLQTALSHPPAVKPGDTIWVRGGTYGIPGGWGGGQYIYASFLRGTADNPIHVKVYPDETVILDRAGTQTGVQFLQIVSHYTWYWDFISTDTSTGPRNGGQNLLISGVGNKLINWVIHDSVNNSYGRSGNELHGCIMFNNGIDGSNGAHHLYVQNPDPSNPTRISECIIFNGYAYGIHAYASGSGIVDGIIMEGNVLFNNGVAQTNGELKDNIIVAGINGISQVEIRDNMTWTPTRGTRSIALGRYWNDNHDITVVNNYLVGDFWIANPFTITTITGNTFYSTFRGVDPLDHPDNLYYSNAPTVNKVFVRPNAYTPKRGHVVVYNWENLDFVQVDLSSIFEVGDWFKVRNAEDYFSHPVMIREYTGGLISFPMNLPETAQPVGPGKIDPWERTGKAFNVFVILPQEPLVLTERMYLPIVNR